MYFETQLCFRGVKSRTTCKGKKKDSIHITIHDGHHTVDCNAEWYYLLQKLSVFVLRCFRSLISKAINTLPKTNQKEPQHKEYVFRMEKRARPTSLIQYDHLLPSWIWKLNEILMTETNKQTFKYQKLIHYICLYVKWFPPYTLFMFYIWPPAAILDFEYDLFYSIHFLGASWSFLF